MLGEVLEDLIHGETSLFLLWLLLLLGLLTLGWLLVGHVVVPNVFFVGGFLIQETVAFF